MQPLVRPARPEDQEVPELLYLSAAPYYDAFAGGRERALTLLDELYPHGRHSASHDVCTVAEIDGRVVGAMASFPAADGDRQARRLLRMCFARMAPWRWPRTAGHLRAASLVSPLPPTDSFYVDALAVVPWARRAGVARSLLECAEGLAVHAGCRSVALDTGVDNEGARRAYEACGFELRTERLAPDDRTARAVGGRGFVSYVKTLG